MDSNDVALEAGDRFEGGDGNDAVGGFTRGGTFVGGPGDDEVLFFVSGTFYGGPGNDRAADMQGGTFYGGDGNDLVVTLAGGTFYGEAGNDDGGVVRGSAVFLGGEGNDRADHVWGQGLYCGGVGDDGAVLLSVPNQPDGSPAPGQGGTFIGEAGSDVAGLIFPGGTFIQDGTCPVAFVPPPATP
jgi:hypothetical protein